MRLQRGIVALWVVIACESAGLVVLGSLLRASGKREALLTPPFVFENLGHGFWRMPRQMLINPSAMEGVPMVLEGVDHSTVVQWENTYLGGPAWISIAPSGRHAAYEDEGQVLVFNPGSLTIDTLAKLGGADQGDISWDESRHRVTLVARKGRPEAMVRLDKHEDWKRGR